MKALQSVFVVFSCFVIHAAMAQESATEATQSSPNQSTDANAVTAEAEDRELTRAERRAQRQAERDAEREAREAATAAAAPAAADSGDDDEGIICRRESVIGSHQRVRICTTRAEREASREAARDVLRDVSRPRGDFGTEGN